MQGNLNALGLIALPLFTAFILWQFGSLKPKRIWIGLLCGLFAVFIIHVPFDYACLPGNNPKLQANLAAFYLVLVLVFVNRKKVMWIASITLLLAGFVLSWHFHYLIFKEGSYTGVPNIFTCSSPETTGKEISVKLWHTSLTGLYEIKR